MSISNLPTELLVNILEYVPIRNAMNVILVNKEWHQEYLGMLVRHNLLETLKELKAEKKEIARERIVIDKLFKHYGEDPSFEGLFPDWLWEGKHKNNRYKSQHNTRHLCKIYY